jgi:drug/metabolite transporter (DMT)-like permease
MEPSTVTPRPTPRRGARLLTTAAGTRPEAFGPVEWGLLGVTASIWGCSFLFIAVAVDHFAPPLVVLLRIAFGAAVLGVVPAARRPVPRAELPRLLLVAATWMAVPFLCFSFAEQWITSSLAGMVNGAVPLTTALVAALLLGRAPGPRQLAGLVVGFGGVVCIAAPALGDGGERVVLGVALVVAAVWCYGLGTNVCVPLQQAYGSLPILLRAQLLALAMSAPAGIAAIPSSTFAWDSLGATVALGALGTGVAFVAATTLIGRAGATRGTVAVYFTPIVAIAAGVAVRDEHVAALSIVGVALVLAGAALTTRAES